MGEYSDVNGVPFTDEDIERWAAEAESEAGYEGKHLGPRFPHVPSAWARRRDPSRFGLTPRAGRSWMKRRGIATPCPRS